MYKIDKRKLQYIVVFFGSLFLLMQTELINDDYWFADVLGRGENLVKWLIWRYNTWSSRVLIEAALVYMTHNTFLWATITALFTTILIYSIEEITNMSFDWIILLLICYPVAYLNTAGWRATTLNYLWPVACGMLAIVPLIRNVRNESTRIWLYVVAVPATIFAANMEQCSIMLLCVAILYVIHMFHEKKINLYAIYVFLIAFLGVICVLIAPGNVNRKGSETISWFPDYDSIGFFSKIEIGITATLKEFLLKPNIVFFVFALLLLICVNKMYKEKIYNVIAGFPLVITSVSGMFYSVTKNIFPQLSKIIEPFENNHGTVTILNGNNLGSYIPLIVCIGVVASIIISLYLIFWQDMCILIITICGLGIGFLTRLSLAFSPTVWASGERTFFVAYVSIIICTCILARKMYDLDTKKMMKFKYGLVFASVISCCGNLMYVLS